MSKYWPGMTEDVRQYIRACERCTLGKHAAVHPPMGHLSVNRPPQILAIDFTKLDTASDGREKVLVMADVFTKYTLCSSPHQEPGGGDGRAGPRPGLSGSARLRSPRTHPQ